MVLFSQCCGTDRVSQGLVWFYLELAGIDGIRGGGRGWGEGVAELRYLGEGGIEGCG